MKCLGYVETDTVMSVKTVFALKQEVKITISCLNKADLFSNTLMKSNKRNKELATHSFDLPHSLHYCHGFPSCLCGE